LVEGQLLESFEALRLDEEAPIAVGADIRGDLPKGRSEEIEVLDVEVKDVADAGEAINP
jgi:hypothetical protein